MCQIKWIKLLTGTYDDEKIKIIDSMDGRDGTHYIWIRLLIQAAKTNAGGSIYLDEKTPYTKEMLSIIFNRPIDLIENALKILVNLKMIDIDENGIINIINWNKHQNVEGMEKIREQTRKRVNKYRAKNKERENENDEEGIGEKNISGINQEDIEGSIDSKCNDIVTEQNKTETKNKIEKENKNKIKHSKENRGKIKTDEIEGESESKTGMEINDAIMDGKNTQKHESEEKKSFTKHESNIDKIGIGEEEIIDYIRSLNVKIRGSNLNSIKLAVNEHGGENVKAAIGKALEVDRPRMNYINGILNNWKIEGYPESYIDSVKNSSVCKQGNYKGLRFNNFEPRNYDYEKLEKELLGWERE